MKFMTIARASMLAGIMAVAAGAAEPPRMFVPSDEQITPLTAKAEKVALGASRTAVIETLGPADWVVLPREKSAWGPFPHATLLMLYWQNGSCTAVAAGFDPDDNLRALNPGRLSCVNDGEFPVTPDDGLACTQELRAQLCK